MALSEEHWRTAEAKRVLGKCLTALGRYPEAEAYLLESYRTLAAQQHAPTELIGKAGEQLVSLYEAWGKPEQARTYREGLAVE